MNRKLILGGAAAGLVLAAGVGLAVFAGSGGSTAGGYGGTRSTATPSGTGTAPATVTTANTGLGQILVDGRARTLYLFEADPPDKSSCDGACASVWPPLTATGAPHAGGGALAGQLGTLHRGDGGTPGHLPRPPALPLRRRHPAPRHQRARAQPVRRRVVRPRPERKQDREWMMT